MRANFLTGGDVAARTTARTGQHVETWQVSRVIQRGLVAPPGRLGRYFVSTEEDLPRIEGALKEIGYLEPEQVPA